MMRRLLILLLSIPLFVHGQKPVINNFTPTHIEVNQTVTISGSNLSGAQVFFGGVEGTVSSSSANTIKVVVPAGVRNDVLTVLNNGLITQSSKQFFISFSGDDITNFSAEYLLSTDEVDGSDICLCDLNGDGLNDAIIAHNIINNADNNIESEITLFQNQSTPTTTLFSKVSNINNNENNGGFVAVTCGDVDNDGLPDLVFTTSNSQNAKQIFVYKNTSGAGVSIAYQSGLSLRLPASNGSNRTPRKVKITDVDGDGKADLIVGNTLDNTIHIFRNTTAGSINFDTTPTEINVGSTISTGSIAVADLNGDKLPDIAALGFQAPNSGIYILKNISGVGQIKFEIEQGILQNSSRDNLALGDFDNDGLIDLAATSGQLKRVRVYKNTSSNGDITFNFTAPTTINIAGSVPWGIDVGDLNGDGLLDIAVPSVNGGVYTIENTSAGSITFGTPIKLNTSEFVRNLCIGDVNGDAKPDLIFTHAIRTSETTNLGVFTNMNCVVPSVSPNNLEFCIGDPFTLNATKSLGTTYAWAITAGDGDPIPDTDSEAVVTINSGSSATVQVTITNADGCSKSSTATFNLVNGAQPSAPTISGAPAGVICVGDDFTLNASAGQDFEWVQPNGNVVTTQTLNITNASFSDGGTYTLRVRQAGAGQCYSLEATVDVEVSDAPSLSIFNAELDNFCVGSSVQLEVPALGAGFSYQWQLDGATNLGTTNSITATQSGDYTVIVTDNSTMCANTTEVKTLNAVSIPVSVIDNNAQVCNGFATDFTSSSTGQSGFTLHYYWEIENDANTVIHTSNQSSISDYTFPGIGTYDVTLTTGYDSAVVKDCGASTTMAVEVAAPPSIVFNQTEGVQKCQGESISVGLTSPSSADITSYYWALIDASSPNDTLDEVTTATAQVSTPSNVQSVWAVSTITTATGCTVKDTLTVTNFPTDVDISTPDGFDLSNDTVTLENEFFINLQVDNLVSDIQWSPEELINDPTATIVRVFPDQQVVAVTVTGTDANECTVTSQVVIEIDIIRPKKTFSPNGDLKNDCWEVYNISTQGGCEVHIFDSRGRNILVTSTFDENCVWDGNYNGSPVPEGVYYYVIKCETGSISKSGSILLAR